ncbi:60S ribosomal protein L5 [Linum perenne]
MIVLIPPPSESSLLFMIPIQNCQILIIRQKDGGIDIPHNDKRFAGFSKDCKSLDAEVHRKYLYGVHVASYMRRGLGPDDVEALYKKVHAAIRADPTPKKLDKPVSNEHKRHNPKRLTY